MNKSSPAVQFRGHCTLYCRSTFKTITIQYTIIHMDLTSHTIAHGLAAFSVGSVPWTLAFYALFQKPTTSCAILYPTQKQQSRINQVEELHVPKPCSSLIKNGVTLLCDHSFMLRSTWCSGTEGAC